MRDTNDEWEYGCYIDSHIEWMRLVKVHFDYLQHLKHLNETFIDGEIKLCLMRSLG